jgi:N-acetylglucosaminyldiphosphoundecaprenol N-acetyl-beta-D-mannosaminyltransferase
MKYVNFFDYKLSNLNINDLVNRIFNEKDENVKIINCMNPHSFVVSKEDKIFKEALSNAYINLIDGIGVSLYVGIKNLTRINRITGYDLFEKIVSNTLPLNFFFLGSTNENLEKIKNRLLEENKQCKIKTYAPSFSTEFTEEENKKIISSINEFKPHFLFVGMTAPKQEKWSYLNRKKINAKYIINIGAVFDYYSGLFLRPYKVVRILGLEWLSRIIQNPRLWRRTLVSIPKYFSYIWKEIFTINLKISIKVIDEINVLNKKINSESKFIFSAFNLAMTSNLILKKIMNEKSFIYWSDGIFCKFFDYKINKIAGNYFLEKIELNNKFDAIHVIGNLHDKDKKFLRNKFPKLTINFTSLPFGEPEELIKNIDNIDENSLILLTLPTPKQELVAQMILSKFNYGKIICIGGGLSIASGHEKKCPPILEKIGLEFIWRLKNETRRRTVRIIKDIITIIFSLVTFRLSKIQVRKYEE